MSYILTHSPSARRGGLLSIVVGAHVAVLLIALAARAVAPQIMEMPLIVDLIEPAAEEPPPPPDAPPLPVIRSRPVRILPQPVPAEPTPVVEATTSTLPAPAAPLATPVEVKPAPPAPPAEPQTAARFDADYLANPKPPYPLISRRLGEQGTVILRVSVSPQGTADNVDIRTSSGSARLDEAAQKTVRNWNFIPARRGGTPMQSWVLVPVVFNLEH